MLTLEIPRRYRAQIRIAQRYSGGPYSVFYELLCARGGAHAEFYALDEPDQWSASIEIHRLNPSDGCDEPPSDQRCWLLCAPCWHEGSSLWVDERLMDPFLAGDHDEVMKRVIQCADSALYLGDE